MLTVPPPVMNRFTSRSGLSIDVDEMTESFNVELLVEGNRVCLDFGVGGSEAGVADRGCCCCSDGCGDCTIEGCGDVTSTGDRFVLVATDCCRIGDDVSFGELTNEDRAGAELLLEGGIRLIPLVTSGDGDMDEDDSFPRG